MWDGVEERLRRRLARWKRQYLSKGGRITLIKSTLASIPIYQMSIFRMPKSVVKRLEKLQRDFLWGGGNTGRKIHLVNWKVVCTQKDKGGLGIRRMGLLNKALLGKWIWRFAVEKDVVEEGHWGEAWVGGWGLEIKGSPGAFWCGSLEGNFKGNGLVLEQYEVQDFRLAACRNAVVDEVWDPRLGQGGWNLRLGRDSNDWELGLIEELLFLLRDIRVTPEEDSVLWKGGVAFFAWEATWEKILTLDRLQWLGAFGKLPLPYSGSSGCFQRGSKRLCFVGRVLLWGRGVLFTSRLLGVDSGLRVGEGFLFVVPWPWGCLVYLLYALGNVQKEKEVESKEIGKKKFSCDFKQILWPDGIFLTKHPKRRRPSVPMSPSQMSPHGQQPAQMSSPKKEDLQKLQEKEHNLVLDELQQQEADRRAKLVYELMIDNPPSAIVGLVGRKEYEQCAKDLYFFLQVIFVLLRTYISLFSCNDYFSCAVICLFEDAGLRPPRAAVLSAFPELDDIFKQLFEERQKFGEFKPN
ncbi:putative ribonuclease H protein [Vitis vinifera]|uniref:Putative ribonuclease H protein n=1 Tax=Vitis vinifera TaxID=29760 RepID=A0A438DF37_VITVI|nr:putative ribonuclease H protein [Vitis vinifera]